MCARVYGGGWFESAVPKAHNKWQVAVLDFMDSGSECWCRRFMSSEGAHDAAKSLRTAAKALRGRGIAADVAVKKRECCVYLIRLTGGDSK